VSYNFNINGPTIIQFLPNGNPKTLVFGNVMMLHVVNFLHKTEFNKEVTYLLNNNNNNNNNYLPTYCRVSF